MSAYKRLHYSPFDILIIISGIACIVLGAYFFQNSGSQLSLSGEKEQFGIVKDGSGTRKLKDSLQWYEVGIENQLFYGDVIFANESKDIEVELLDKESKLVIPEDSMIKITKSGEEFNLDVSKGSIVIKTKGTRRINLRDKRGKVRKINISKNSDIKISSRKSNVTVEALEGEAELLQVNEKTKKAEPIKIKKDKVLVVSRKKAQVINRENIVSLKVADPVHTSAIPVSNKYKNASSLEVSRSSKFTKSRFLTVRNGFLNTRPLGFGQYYVRAKGGKKIDSFELANIKPMRINISKQSSYFPGDKLKISWTGRKDLTYKVEIPDGEETIVKTVVGNQLPFVIKDGSDIQIKVSEQRFKKVSRKVLSFQISKLIEIDDIKEVQVKRRVFRNLHLRNPRKINYQILVKDKNGKTLIRRKSKSEKFLMKIDKPGPYDLKITNIATKEDLVDTNFVIKDRITDVGNKKVFYSTSKELQANLKWKRGGNIPENMDYVIKIFKEGDRKKPFLEKKTNKTNFVYKTKKEEKFFWKIESTIPELIDSSAMFETRLARPKFPKLKSPKILLKYNKAKKCYAFKVPTYKYITKYDIYIFSSRSKVNQNRKAMYHRILSTNKDCLPAKDLLVFEGKYFYKYRVFDRWKRKSPYSQVGTMFFPISPLDRY